MHATDHKTKYDKEKIIQDQEGRRNYDYHGGPKELGLHKMRLGEQRGKDHQASGS